MDTAERAYLGTQAQQVFLARGSAMHVLTADDSRYTYYGRSVALLEPEESGIAQLTALSRLQGYSNYSRVPSARVSDLRAQAEAAGLVITQYDRWIGGAEALARARAIVAETSVPADLEILAIAPDSPPATLEAFAEMASSCGVLPPALSVIGGRTQPGRCLVARDAQGRVVSCAGAAAHLARAHPESGSECWWGMLATDPARRGERLSLMLGARVIVEMHERYGYSSFMTGIAPGNAASEAVCTRMGLADAGDKILGAADPSMLPGGRMTK